MHISLCATMLSPNPKYIRALNNFYGDMIFYDLKVV